ncbi:MAG: carboxypeptidase-like regulatory domain-containing protein [Planctomycetaceae bacterium]|jgi:hypothetical protein|nr:carboxypeptidase-like regulatory domain-containing protein [Planctomycetaceae bacterium]
MPDGTPAKNTRIVGWGQDAANTHRNDYHAVTNQEGEYTIFLQPEKEIFAGQAYLSTSLDGTGPFGTGGREIFEPLVSEVVTFFHRGRQKSEHHFRLQEAYPLQGTVRHADGTPAKDVNLSISPTNLSVYDEKYDAQFSRIMFSRTTVTDSEGKYRIYLSPGRYYIQAFPRQIEDEKSFNPAEVGPGKNPSVDCVVKNRTLLRPQHVDGTPVFRQAGIETNPSFWKFGEPDMNGKPKWHSVDGGNIVNNGGYIEGYMDGVKNYFFLLSGDFEEGYAGEIPNNLKNLEVYPVQLIPAARVRFRLLDASKKPLVHHPVFCSVRIGNVHAPGTSVSMRIRGNTLQTDKDGMATLPVPALGTLKDRFQYRLSVIDRKNIKGKFPDSRKFAPEKSGDLIDLGDILAE